jgi:hypothetical protein
MTGPDPYQGNPQYQGGDYGLPGHPPPDEPPKPIQHAFKLMVAGAILQALSILLSLLQLGTMRDQISKAARENNSNLTQEEIDGVVAAGVAITVIFGLLFGGLWLWMAFMNRKGRNWARILSTVFFALATLNMVATVLLTVAGAAAGNSFTAGSSTTTGLISTILLWLIGLAAIVLLWNRESSQYFQQRTAYRG